MNSGISLWRYLLPVQVSHISQSPEYKFYNMDQEKILLVEKMCHLKRELAKHEDKAGFYEDHVSQLTDDIKKKSR